MSKQAQNIINVLSYTYKTDREGNYIFHNIHDIMKALQWKNIDDFIIYVADTFKATIYYEAGRYYISKDAIISQMNEYFIKEYDKIHNPPKGVI